MTTIREQGWIINAIDDAKNIVFIIDKEKGK